MTDTIDTDARKRQHRNAVKRYREGRIRIDFYPSPEAMEIIQRHISGYAGGDYSSVINRLICKRND